MSSNSNPIIQFTIPVHGKGTKVELQVNGEFDAEAIDKLQKWLDCASVLITQEAANRTTKTKFWKKFLHH